MSTQSSTEGEWLDWIEVQRASTLAWAADDLSEAIVIVNRFLIADPQMDLKRQAIGFRGSLYQELGDLNSAKEDFLGARNLSEQADFERCTLEQSAGVVSRDLGDKTEARRWFLEAVKTAAADPRADGAGAVLNLLGTQDQKQLSVEERSLCERVIRGCWRISTLQGEPELEDLELAAQKVIQALNRPPSGSAAP